ncbi:hypothetical protein UMM65_03610 [Aureibaculum sp. 2210JD6-5]|uniref:hypothetical protein n=1 Tax=Aureibaculum sp. 2210JD6-5 TaxID=3103957 RepID=UPI002AADEA5F|nr:hypothetical protein [Aureibaculum sp. 2210JD6-5]MDY7394313.1 hypothetical protein [Aureibaculum sp. 2210JD6-5]
MKKSRILLVLAVVAFATLSAFVSVPNQNASPNTEMASNVVYVKNLGQCEVLGTLYGCTTTPSTFLCTVPLPDSNGGWIDEPVYNENCEPLYRR